MLAPLDGMTPSPAMQRSLNRLRRVALLIVVSGTLLPAAGIAQTEQRVLVTEAKLTLASFASDPDMKSLQSNLGRARAVLIAPNVAKAGFIVGGSGGRAVAIVRDAKTGKWAGPAFYTLATASVGFQAGIAVSELVTLVMTEKGLNSLLSNSFRMGGDLSIAVGPVGGGARSNLTADLVSFSRSQGVYAGLNFDGTIVSTADEWNRIYYGKEASPADILVRMNVHNVQASELLNVAAEAARKQTAAADPAEKK
jgi:lipid-binding SYLF domain-containing protein